MWLLCIAVWLLSGVVKGEWDSFGVIPCDSNAMGWSSALTSEFFQRGSGRVARGRGPALLLGECERELCC